MENIKSFWIANLVFIGLAIWFCITVWGWIFPATKGDSTHAGQNCHPSYSGCLNPNASDYDCVGGSGNGPYYTGRVRVIGPDVFGLDRDGDGWGCE